MYFGLFGHFRDPVKFLLHPIRSAKHKGSVVTGIGLDAFTGQDWAGRKFTSLGELTGFDDKGTYNTSREGQFEVGDPKGGKKRGQLTARDFLARNEALRVEQIPSFLLYETRSLLPIPLQSSLSFLSGEYDAFVSISRGLGFAVSQSFGEQNINKLLEQSSKRIFTEKEETDFYQIIDDAVESKIITENVARNRRSKFRNNQINLKNVKKK